MDRKALEESLDREIVYTYSRSGGPGGQNVNKVNSKVTAVLAMEKLEGLTEDELGRVRVKLAGRINQKDELVIQGEEDRSQVRNRTIVRERILNLLTESARSPKKRRPTRPGRAAREERLSRKKRQKEKKSLRRSVSFDD